MSIEAIPLTELEAVNEILSTGSESPISTLDDTQVIDAALAQQILRTTSIEIQTQGWFFNEETEYPLTPDQDGHVILPRNTLKVDTSGDSATIDAISRGRRLYNKTDRTYEWDGDVTVDIVLGLAFDELPSSVRNYITIRAARKYQDRYFTDQALHSYTSDDEMRARVVVRQEEIDSRDSNYLTDSTFHTTLQGRS